MPQSAGNRVFIIALPALLFAMSCVAIQSFAQKQTAVQMQIDQSMKLTDSGKYTDAVNLIADAFRGKYGLPESDERILLLLRLGVNLELCGRYEEAYRALASAMKLSELTGVQTYLSEINLNIGILFFDMNQSDNARHYYREAYRIASAQSDTFAMIRAMNNAGNAYLTLDANADSAVVYLVPAFQLAEKVNYRSAIMAIGGNLAQLYLLRNDFHKAGMLTRKLLDMDSLNAYFHFAQGLVYRKSAQIELARQSCLTALQLTDYAEFKMAIFQELSSIEADRGHSEQALQYLENYLALKDSLNSAELSQHVRSLEARYENEKKLRRIEQLERDTIIRQRRLQQLTLLLAIVILLAAGIVLWLRNQRLKVQHRLEMKAEMMEKMRIEAENRATRSYLDGEESERKRLAGELHDGMGGLLTGIRLQIDAALASNFKEQNSEWNKIGANVLFAGNELRRISRNLFPQTLVECGLKAALDDMVGWYRRQIERPAIMFYFSGEQNRYDHLLEMQVFRVIQELVNNALKHANPDQIDIELILQKFRIWVSVTDNGTGFDMRSVAHGQGLRSMHERISLMNGSFDINSVPGQGTHASIEIIMKENIAAL